MKRIPRIPSCAERGMTLVELMVGLTLGLVITTALLTLFANSSAQGQNFARASAQIENGRYVSELMQDSVSLAGFVGELSTKSVAFDDPDPCATDPTGSFVYDSAAATPVTVPAAVQGIGTGEAISATCSAALSDRKAGTQALVVRRLDTDTVEVASLAATNSAFYVQYSFCSTDPTTTLIFSNKKSDFTLHKSDCTSLAPVRRYVAQVYYIASCNDCSGSGDGVPTLKRAEQQVGAQPTITALADGVYTLRLEYGFDTDGDGNVNQYLSALGATGATASWSNVTAVRVHVITQSTDKVLGTGLAKTQTFQFGSLDPVTIPANSYTYRGYSTVVRLMNPAGARES